MSQKHKYSKCDKRTCNGNEKENNQNYHVFFYENGANVYEKKRAEFDEKVTRLLKYWLRISAVECST